MIRKLTIWVTNSPIGGRRIDCEVVKADGERLRIINAKRRDTICFIEQLFKIPPEV